MFKWHTQTLFAAAVALSLLGCNGSGSDGSLSTDSNGSDDTDSATGIDSEFQTDGTVSDSSSESATASEVDTTGCGNGVIETGLGEVCDDGNSLPGDGCSALCDEVENGFACPLPGIQCVSTVVCGDGKITGQEGCDDGNTVSSDGCSKACELEEGWICPLPGQRCQAAACGDGIVAGKEECDDGDSDSSDGCSDLCKLEPGWACTQGGEPCHETMCNDGKKEGSEPCDDGNDIVGDGCNPFCQVEPSCDTDGCASECGDGMILPGDHEECDDGNTLSGDGCSATCKIELGFVCDIVTTELPEVLEVPITYRDFISLPIGDAVRHPDFQMNTGTQKGLVLDSLDADGKPVWSGLCSESSPDPCGNSFLTTTAENFAQWYRNVPGVNLTKVSTLALSRQPDDTYYLNNPTFFPWDNDGFVALGEEDTYNGHNFGFTSELRTWFQFNGGEQLLFSGDDDVWVFIAGKLVVDLGGVHAKLAGSFLLDEDTAATLGLQVGKIYEMALFQAERHTVASNYELTLGGFVSSHSECKTTCGDGIVAGDEVCDDGVNDGSYGSCLPGCTGRGPYCGDGDLQPEGAEVCDDGTNLTIWSPTGEPGCAPGCVLGSYCGDGTIDSWFGEECDDSGPSDKCTVDCKLGERCGDGKVQAGEECDDGNTVSGDGCNSTCDNESPI